MFSLLMEELARDRDRARLIEARAKRLASASRAAAARRRPHPEAPAVGAIRRVAGRRFIEFGAWLAGPAVAALVGHRPVAQPAGRCAHCLW